MAHPSRRRYVDMLREQFDRAVPVQYDPSLTPSADKQQRWKNGRMAWEQVDPDSDFAMVIQDDATVCPDLIAGLEQALAYVPDDVGAVQPFIARSGCSIDLQFAQQAYQADQRRASWIERRSLRWGVAIIVRTCTVGDMLDWGGKHEKLAYDSRIGRYYRYVLGQSTWYTWPSLVDHRDLPSLVGHGRGRVAYEAHAGSALELRWDGPVIRDIQAVPQRGRYLRRRVGHSFRPF